MIILGAATALAVHHTTPTTNVAGWAIVLALLALGLFGLFRLIFPKK